MALLRARQAAPPPPRRKPSHLQHQRTPLVHGSRQAKYNCSCGNNQGKVVCSCPACHSDLRNGHSPCRYYGHCVEPLAWDIEHEIVRTQSQCALFTVLPVELRTLVFEFALIDTKGQSLESLMKRLAPSTALATQKSINDIATSLLRTCRAIYLETWTLPLSLNACIIQDLDQAGRVNAKLYELLPWQIGLIQRLDITLQQNALEGGTLHNYIHSNNAWHPGPRHAGVYVAPRWYKDVKGSHCAMTEFPVSFFATLVPALEEHGRHFLSHILGQQKRYPEDSPPPWSSAMRVMLAKPITHLTLRFQHTDWWTWTDDPRSTDEFQHLALDPTVGGGRDVQGSRPTASRMRALAESRRAGYDPEVKPDMGWARTIAQMPDLRSFELVLEMFAVKKRQLDDVVEAAKTWKFPLDGGRWELVWDGEVGMSSWSRSADKGADAVWYQWENTFEVRNVRFTRRAA